jgi:hypothetical protein
VAELPHKEAFDTLDLYVVERAFASTWETIVTTRPFRDFTKDEELKTLIRQKLFAFAGQGMIDPELLRSLTLECLPLNGNGSDTPTLRASRVSLIGR